MNKSRVVFVYTTHRTKTELFRILSYVVCLPIIMLWSDKCMSLGFKSDVKNMHTHKGKEDCMRFEETLLQGLYQAFKFQCLSFNRAFNNVDLVLCFNCDRMYIYSE